MRKKFGQVLLEQGLITPAQLADALTHQGRNGMRLGQALVARGHITEDQLVISLGQALATRVVDLSRVQPDPAALHLVQPAFASEHDLFPISVTEAGGVKRMTVAVADPLNLRGLDELGFLTGTEIEPVLAKLTAIDMAIRRHYGGPLNAGPDSDAPAPARAASSVSEDLHLAPPDDARTSPPPLPSAVSLSSDLSSDFGSPPGAGSPSTVGARSSNPVDDVIRAEDGALESETDPPIPLTQMKRPASGFDAELGKLIEAAGDQVQDEAIGRLERRFWALMRVLAKKGLINNEEFQRELNEEEAAFRSPQ